MKKIFFHNEAIIKRGHPVNFFFVVVKGNANILNSKGNSTLKVLKQGEVYRVLYTLKENGLQEIQVIRNISTRVIANIAALKTKSALNKELVTVFD